jgi:outer membrane protein OmpA-like peptidoglycan-associated protein
MLLLLPTAFAQDPVAGGAVPPLDAQTFRPAIDSHTFLRVLDSDLPERRFSANILLSYTMDPLQYTGFDGVTSDVIANLVQLDAMASWRLDAFRIGVDVPIYLRSFGGTSPDATGLGDVSLDGKVRLLDHDAAPVGLAGVVRIAVPVSTVPAGLGAGGAGVDLAIAVDRPVGSRLTLALDAGTSLMPAVQLENVTWGSQLFGTAGAAYTVTDRVGLLAELHGAGVLADLGNPNAAPVEVLLGGWGRAGADRSLLVRPGVGFGLTDAVATPKLRAMVAVGWDPLVDRPRRDRDHDGLADDRDVCPDAPEDADGYEDTDGCPEPTPVTIVVTDTDDQPAPDAAFTVAGGPSGRSGDTVGIAAGKHEITSGTVTLAADIAAGPPASVVIRVPAPRGTLHVDARDKDGHPVPGVTWVATGPTKASGGAGADVKVRPGTYQISGTAPGWRTSVASAVVAKDGTASLVLELLPSKAELKAERIEIHDSVYFETAKSTIKPESYALLDEVAEILVAHPELTKVRIEGNTDSRGAADANLRLSQGRAEAVRDYLVGKGVARGRLDAIGNGENRPLVTGENEEAWAKNRRVDFLVVERSGEESPR